MSKDQARNLARQLARNAGLDENTADAVARSYAAIHDDEFTDREVRHLIQQEIQYHAQP